ncbi:hypothetical protein LVY72_02150 [Arthrobacter sp. I2-34]|uniref:Uncharacterized protein n=1 Tax=Arthrobacter hankyongi TaxID=2904801 RepID=A0ABS9L235_9MICC|nr:hypothetical protein [Arthrobacter hankyongi]MCG2620709.1 hypothetical protein [Arthrobacter hankyongi]
MVARFFGSLFGTPRPEDGAGPEPAPEPDDDARTAAALDRLRSAVRAAGRDLPGIISSQLRQIDDVLQPLAEYAQAQGASTEQRVLLEAMVVDYIPTPLNAYLALREEDRDEGTRATAMFAEQLTILFDTAQDLNHQVRSGAITELSTYARFLDDKFGPSMLTRGGN